MIFMRSVLRSASFIAACWILPRTFKQGIPDPCLIIPESRCFWQQDKVHRKMGLRAEVRLEWRPQPGTLKLGPSRGRKTGLHRRVDRARAYAPGSIAT